MASLLVTSALPYAPHVAPVPLHSMLFLSSARTHSFFLSKQSLFRSASVLFLLLRKLKLLCFCSFFLLRTTAAEPLLLLLPFAPHWKPHLPSQLSPFPSSPLCFSLLHEVRSLFFSHFPTQAINIFTTDLFPFPPSAVSRDTKNDSFLKSAFFFKTQ